MNKVELHVHTCYSKDSILTLPFLLMMCKIKGIKTIAITDHNEIRGAQIFQKKLSKHKIDVIVGEEIMTTEGEIIGLFLNKKIEANQTPIETINKIKEQNGLVYLPHPYDEYRKKSVLSQKEQKNIKNSIDIIEIHNGRNMKEYYSKKQQEIQKEIGAVPIIGSDAHTFFELGRNYVEIQGTINRENFKNKIKNGSFRTKKCLKISHKVTKMAKLFKIIMKGEFYEIYRIIKRKCK